MLEVLLYSPPGPRGATMDTSSSTADAGFLTIREICQELGVTLRTLRFYETKGLIAPKRKKRQRFYHTKDVECLRTIVKLKSWGLSLREIRETLQSPGDGPYGLTASLCEELIERVSAQQAEAQAALAYLRGLQSPWPLGNQPGRNRVDTEPAMAYYRRMAQRYRELAAGSPDLEMVEGWRALADECDKLAEAMNASPPEPDHTSMQRKPVQRRQQKKLQDET